MAIKRQKGPKKVETIKIEKEENEKREIILLSNTPSQGVEKSVWGWLEEFTIEWSETFITKKRKKPPTR